MIGSSDSDRLRVTRDPETNLATEFCENSNNRGPR
jgi:hypothetical protein